jgi:hypothetical protein
VEVNYSKCHDNEAYHSEYERDITLNLMFVYVALGGLVVSVLATGPKVRRFKPG